MSEARIIAEKTSFIDKEKTYKLLEKNGKYQIESYKSGKRTTIITKWTKLAREIVYEKFYNIE